MTAPRLRRALSHPALLAVGALALLACLLHSEVIFSGQVYHMDDAADGYYPGHIAVQRAFAAGEMPTWETGSWSGWPLIVDPYNGIFYPLNAVYYALGAARGLGFAIALHILLGGAGMWWLLRRRKLSFGAALAGAVAFSLSTFFVVRIRHVIFVQMTAWLPWILAGIEGWMQTRRRRELVLVGGATALALVAGALSIGHFAVLAIAGYTLARVLGRGEGERQHHAAVDLGALGGAALLGALCAAAQIVPTVAHLPHSPRALGSDYAFASSYAWPSLQYLVTLLAPDFFGTEDRFRYFGMPNHWELAGWYTGALTLALAPLALLRGGGGRRRGAELFVLVGLVVLAIGLALGDAGPFHPFFFRYVPLYAALRCPARALLIAVVVVPILGAHGLEALLERRLSRRRWLGIGAAALALGAGVAIALLLRPHRGTPPHVAVAREALSHLSWVAGAGVAAALLSILDVLPRRVVALAVAAVIAADLLLVGRPYLQPQPADYPAGMERFAAVEWVRAQGGGDRMVNDPRGPFRLHNVGMVLGLENASGYDSVGIWRYVNLLYLMQHGRPYPERKLKHDFAGIGVWGLSSPMLDVMNVRWLIAESSPDGGFGQGRWIERFRPRPPTGAPAEKYEPDWDARLRVFENRDVLPRAFVVHRAEVHASDQTLAARIVGRGFDPSRVVLLEERPSVDLPAPEGGDLPPHTPAKLLLHRRHRVEIEVEDPAPGVLVVGDAHYPGWSVTVDGQPRPLLRADWAFRGVALEPGRHRVVMTYASRPTRVGAILSLAGLAGLAALGLLRRRRAA